MKKLIVSILFVLILSGCSCQNQTVSHNGGVTLTVPDEILAHFVEGTKVPVKHFEFDGTLNVANFSTKDKYLLAGNDHYKVSDAFSLHLSSFNDQFINTSSENQVNDDGVARIGSDKLPIDSPNQYSTEIKRVAWDSDGTRFSYQFRTFKSGGKEYYVYSYTTNITLILELSLMVIEREGNNELVMIPLPYNTLYEVGKNIQLDKLIEKNTYINPVYYTFIYPSNLDAKSLVEKEEAVKEWYRTYCGGFEENGQFKINYLNQPFEIIFGQKKVSKTTNDEKDAFLIKYLGD